MKVILVRKGSQARNEGASGACQLDLLCATVFRVGNTSSKPIVLETIQHLGMRAFGHSEGLDGIGGARPVRRIELPQSDPFGERDAVLFDEPLEPSGYVVRNEAQPKTRVLFKCADHGRVTPLLTRSRTRNSHGSPVTNLVSWETMSSLVEPGTKGVSLLGRASSSPNRKRNWRPPMELPEDVERPTRYLPHTGGASFQQRCGCRVQKRPRGLPLNHAIRSASSR